MSDIELVIKIDEEQYEFIKQSMTMDKVKDYPALLYAICEHVKNGIPLPKGHGRLIDENYLLSILQCEEYETCTWRNCSDCNREKCIRRREILGAQTIIEADKEESEDKE